MSEKASFFSKTQSRSRMTSDFLVCHPSESFFSLSESEFMTVSKVYANLLDDSGIHYVQYSATAGTNLGYDIGKKIGTRCPVHSIEFVDTNGATQQISCYFSDGEHKEKSKGLLISAKELKIDVNDKIKLDELHQTLSNHPAFRNVSRLEKLAAKYQIKIIFNPKDHCELNPIEGL